MIQSMDLELMEAICVGDVDFLKKAVASKPTDYFLTQYTPPEGSRKSLVEGNIFHLAVRSNQVEILREAMNLLPIELQHELFLQKDGLGLNPLHRAASQSHEFVRIILDFYKAYSDQLLCSTSTNDNHPYRPWLALGTFPHKMPLNIAIQSKNEESAMEILSMDMELFCGMVDNEGNSFLFLAVKDGLTQVAEKILMSSFVSSVSGKDYSTPLHYAPNCSGLHLIRLLHYYYFFFLL
ncbi:hypothetical protein BVRB_3g058580 [Beta vulgaris subsp. vulgaris]|nr:hypothetical protein BVRB_3g058580 [Beta vulgaris subsp. vulgaris]